MQALPPAPFANNQIGGFQDVQVFGDGLTAHGVVLAKLAQCLAASLAQAVQQGAPGRISKRFEYRIGVHDLTYATKWLPNQGCLRAFPA